MTSPTSSTHPTPRFQWINYFLTALILLNILAFIAGTVPEIGVRYERELSWFEDFSVAIFSIEYVARLATCTSSARFSRPILGRLRYALTPLALIDLCSILPFYLPKLGLDLRVFRVFRFMRLMRVLKLGRYSDSLQLIRSVLLKKKEELGATLFVVLVLLVLSSSLIYFAENEAQPKGFGSIPLCMWWAVTTLTTIGYGDLYPVTAAGKVIGSFVAILGIGVFALPTGILGAAFLDEMNARKRQPLTPAMPTCPHCGKPLS